MSIGVLPERCAPSCEPVRDSSAGAYEASGGRIAQRVNVFTPVAGSK
jgi:hypothetical protein